MNPIIVDDMFRSSKLLSTVIAGNVEKIDSYYICSDSSGFGEYLACIISECIKASGQKSTVHLCQYLGKPSALNTMLDENHSLISITQSIQNIDINNYESSALIFCVNCTDAIYKDDTLCAIVKNEFKCGLAARGFRKVLFTPIINVPTLENNNDIGLAEMELNFLIHRTGNYSDVLYDSLSQIFRDFVSINSEISLEVRFDNIFGPLLQLGNKAQFNEIISSALQNHSLEISYKDYNNKFSCIYESDAANAAMYVLFRGKNGNIYNASDSGICYADVLKCLYNIFPEEFSIKAEKKPLKQSQFVTQMDNLKIRSIGWKPHTAFNDAVNRCFCYRAGIEYDIKIEKTFYMGKLKRLKSLEFEMLKEVDNICRENNISYFLAGGSLLGAVRHRDIIPWDDDVDVAMLRRDFDKFREICPKRLNPKYSYETYSDGKGSYYQFDKIRINGTFFATKFSNKFDIANGIFLDILVYDQTSNNGFLRKKHLRAIQIWTYLLYARWRQTPRKDTHYKSVKFLLPVLSLFSMHFYNKVLECMLKLYKNKKNAKFLIDGVGQNLVKGPFPSKWLETTVETDFGELKIPIPSEYDCYLRHFYGDNYMKLLPYSKRKSGHALARIDLGEYLFKDELSMENPKIIIKGELYY